MVSNPCTWFATGGGFDDLKSFTYEGGSTLFHFSTKMLESELFKNWIPVNVVFFANDEKHAVEVLIRMFEFLLDCKAQYLSYIDGKGKNTAHADYYKERAEKESSTVMVILGELRSGAVLPEKAPTNQFYKVGFASNDTML